MEPHLTTICYVAGHSGGHIIPLVSLIEQEKQKKPLTHCVIITSSKQLDRTIVAKSSCIDQTHTLPITQRRSWYYLPILASALVWSFIQSMAILVKNRPKKIVTTGSIVAIPASLAAWFLRIPIELWEVNPKPGKTIYLLARFATSIHVCFEQTKDYFNLKNIQIADYPIRLELKQQETPYTNSYFSKNRITLFIQGGSQGSQGINNFLQETIKQYPDLAAKIQIIHQAGPQVQALEQFYKINCIPAHVFAYDHALAQYYLAADTIICRSGAGTLFESVFFKKPCLTIPLESAGGGTSGRKCPGHGERISLVNNSKKTE